jgi:hypothetical protein
MVWGEVRRDQVGGGKETGNGSRHDVTDERASIQHGSVGTILNPRNRVIMLRTSSKASAHCHRNSPSRKRRRKGKSQIWDSKIRSQVPRDSDPRKTALARANRICKGQTRPLVREGAPQKQHRNCQTVINILSWVPDGARHLDLLTDWLTVGRNVTLTWPRSESRTRSRHVEEQYRVQLRVQFCRGGCEEKNLCVIFGVCNSVKTLSRFSHSWDLLPSNC